MDKDLFKLISLTIPEAKPVELGFLDVVGHTTRENTINNVYRYFLDPKDSPVISKLLLDTLLELIAERYKAKGHEKELELGDYTVHREYNTGNGRIDLVLESKKDKCAIIVEVKVYHWLVNDLADYWRAFDYDDERKAAIVLSLASIRELNTDSGHFISISHSEWLNRTIQKGVPFDMPFKEMLYFKDFVSNMNRLTNSAEMSEGIEFYLTHAEKINKALEVKEEAYEFILKQFRTVAANLGVELYGSDRNWRHIWDSANNATAYFAVLPEEAINGKGHVMVILEVYSKALPFKNEIWEHINEDIQRLQLEKLSKGTAHYQHIAGKTYTFLPNEYSQLSDRLTEGIKKELEPLRMKVMEFLKTKGANRND